MAKSKRNQTLMDAANKTFADDQGTPAGDVAPGETDTPPAGDVSSEACQPENGQEPKTPVGETDTPDDQSGPTVDETNTPADETNHVPGVEWVTITVPLIKRFDMARERFPQHMEFRFRNGAQREAMARLLLGCRKANIRGRDGRSVEDYARLGRWLAEQIGEQISHPKIKMEPQVIMPTR